MGVLLTASVLGANKYVSSSGSDTTGDGTAAKPYRSIMRANTAAAAGDTIKICSDVNFVTNFTSDGNVTGTGWIQRALICTGAFTEDSSYYTSKFVYFNKAIGDDGGAFKINIKTNDNQLGIAVGAGRAAIATEGVTFYISSDHPAIPLNLDNTGGDPATNVWQTIEPNEGRVSLLTASSAFNASGNPMVFPSTDNYRIRNIDFRTLTENDDAYCISNSAESDSITGLIVENCNFYGFRDSVHSHTSDTIIRNNYVEMSGSAVHAFAFVVDGNNCWIGNNVIKGPAGVVDYGAGGVGGIAATVNANGTIIRENILYGFNADSILTGANYTGLITVHGKATEISNNTIYGLTCNDSGSYADAGVLLFSLGGSSPKVNVLQNNIIVNTINGIDVNNGNVVSPNNNCLYGHTGSSYTNVSAGVNDIVADPRFVNSTINDFNCLNPTIWTGGYGGTYIGAEPPAITFGGNALSNPKSGGKQ